LPAAQFGAYFGKSLPDLKGFDTGVIEAILSGNQETVATTA
jgi:hypothetical protein